MAERKTIAWNSPDLWGIYGRQFGQNGSGVDLTNQGIPILYSLGDSGVTKNELGADWQFTHGVADSANPNTFYGGPARGVTKGSDLTRQMIERGMLTPQQVVEYMNQSASGIDAALNPDGSISYTNIDHSNDFDFGNVLLGGLAAGLGAYSGGFGLGELFGGLGGGSGAAAAGGGDLGLFNAGVGGSGAIGGSGAAAAGAGLGGSMDWGDALSQGWDLGSGAGNYAPVEDLSRWYDASTQAFIPDAGNVFASITKNPGLADLLFGGASGGLSSIAKGIGGLFGGGAQAGGLGSLFGGSGGGLNFGNLAAGSIPVLAAIDYARGQKPFDTSRLEDLYGRYNPNAQAYEYDQNTGLGRSALTSSLQQRGVMGSSFGDQSLTNFNTSRDLGRQSLLNQGIGGQAGIAGQILNANVASQANKNQLYGSALNALGNIFSTKPNFTLGY